MKLLRQIIKLKMWLHKWAEMLTNDEIKEVINELEDIKAELDD